MIDVENIIETKNKELKSIYKGSLSVSKLNSEFIIREKFDDVAKAAECAQKGLEDPNYKYAGMTATDILEQWHAKADESKRYGTMLDDYAGLRLTGTVDELNEWKDLNGFEYDSRLNSNCAGFDQFYDFIQKSTNYKYVARELPLYYETSAGNKINGRFDCLFYDENTDAYIIIDWKTTDDIATKCKFGKKMLAGPAYDLEECEMNKYTIQLHIYKSALVKTYGLSTYDKISVYVCNVLKTPGEDGKLFKLYKQNFDFDVNKIESIVDFGNKEFLKYKNKGK